MNTGDYIDLYKKESIDIVNNVSSASIEQFINLIYEAYTTENTVYLAGNGGNAAYVQNFVVDLNMHPFVSEDKSSNSSIPRNLFKSVSLCSDPATISGISNDLGFNSIFKEQMKYQGIRNDIFIGISGSGNSKNILEAMEFNSRKGIKNILLTRNKENKCNEFADLTISVDGVSKFPGQTGGNNNNFHFEDFISKLSHITVGILKLRVQQRIQNA